MPKDNPEALRLGTWNIRWFPRGCHPEEDCPENVTDISWLACTIAWMNVDLLAIQEILTSQSAQTAMNTLRTELDHLTGGSWQVDLQKCGGATSQHVGYLWNSHRITLERQVDVPALNGASPGSPTTACAARLRPGRYAHAKTNAAVDFHIISVHLDSGTANRDYQNRRTATGRIGDVEIDGTPLSASDRDIIVLGDYNTMGRKEPPPISSQEEIATLDQDLAPGFRRRPETPACTEYSDNKAGTLDHVVVSAGMQEAAAAARVTGYLCGRAVHGGLEYDAGSLRTALRPLPGCV